jgi:hypothetical protein
MNLKMVKPETEMSPEIAKAPEAPEMAEQAVEPAAQKAPARPRLPNLDTAGKMFRVQAANYINKFVEYAQASKAVFKKALVERIKYTRKNFAGIEADILAALIGDMDAALPPAAPVEAKLKPKKLAAPIAEPKQEKPKSAFPEAIEVEGVGRMKLLKGISYGDFQKAVEEDERELYVALHYTAKRIREFEYEKAKEVKAPAKFPNDLDVCQPVYFADSLKRAVMASVYTEGIGRIHVEDFETGDGGAQRNTIGIPFEVYELEAEEE